MLDDQTFQLGSAFLSDWLVSVTVSNTGGISGGTTPNSRTSLAAITVDTVAPEPSTLILFGAGLGAMLFMRRRLASRS